MPFTSPGTSHRYPALLTRVLAVGAVGGVGVAAASRVDWGAVSRGGVALAALLLVADRALPTGVRPSAKLRWGSGQRVGDICVGPGGGGVTFMIS